MASQICIFEDNRVRQFNPLVFFRPVYDLRCGITTLREKIQLAFPKAHSTLHCREFLTATVRQNNPAVPVNGIAVSGCLLVNGRVVADDKLAKQIPLKPKSDVVFTKGDNIVAAFVSGRNLDRIKSRMGVELSPVDFEGIPTEEIEAELVAYPWELVARNGKQITTDVASMMKRERPKKMIRGSVHKGVHLLEKKQILIGEGTTVKPGVVIDAEEGPVFIGRNVHVFPQATLIGPLFIGDGSFIKVGAQVYENTSIGPMSKVGGEVEAVIIQSHSNKQHAGFLGHAYLGSWVNLGADTNNSDLKNNYGTVKVTVNEEPIDTGLQFVGLTMGDHSKSSINSMFNTGTVVGVSSNIFGNGFPSKSVPSFTWGAAGDVMEPFAVEKAIQVAKRVMARRKVEMTPADEQLFKTVFEMTSGERTRAMAKRASVSND